jgi:hypothetical protein
MHYEDREKEIKDIRSIRERRSRAVHYQSVVDLGFERGWELIFSFILSAPATSHHHLSCGCTPVAATRLFRSELR